MALFGTINVVTLPQHANPYVLWWGLGLGALVIYVVAGCVTGFLSGLFGVGGGTLIVPVLLVVFTAQGVPVDVMVHMAVGSSLTVIIVTSLASVRAHWRLGGVQIPVVARLVPGMVLGALLGAVIADQMSGQLLQTIFGIFLCALSVQVGLGLRPKTVGTLPGAVGLSVAGGVIGSISALVGIGGGALTVSYLARYGMAMRQAVGISAACGLFIAVAGSVGFIVTGWNNPQVSGMTSGYVYWPAVVSIAIASVFLAPSGARLAHWLSQKTMQRLFAVFLLLVGVRLLTS